MKLRAIALIAFLFVLTVAANAQATRADLPAPDNFLGIATFSLWDGDAPGALGEEPYPVDIKALTKCNARVATLTVDFESQYDGSELDMKAWPGKAPPLPMSLPIKGR